MVSLRLGSLAFGMSMALGLVVLGTGRVEAARAVVLDRDGVLWDVALDSGLYTNPRATVVPGCTGCLGLGGNGGALETDGEGRLYGMSLASLSLVDEATGELDFVGSYNTPGFYPGGMTWDPATGRMFASYLPLNAASRALYEVDLQSGRLELLTGIRLFRGGVSALAAGPRGGLYALSSRFDGEIIDTLVQFDKEDGAVLSEIDLSQDVSSGGAASMDYDQESQRMYVASTPGFGIAPSLYTIDFRSGRVSLIGSESRFIVPVSMVILPDRQVPEPSAVLLGLLAVASQASARRSRLASR